MVGVYSLNIADRFVISTVLEPIRLELGLSDAGVAFLSGVSLALFYVVFGFPIAWLLDRASRRNLIALSLILWSAMTVCTGLSRNYTQLLLSRFGVGFGEAGGTPGANSLISDFFPAARRPMALTVFALGAPLGAWLGADAAGKISDLHGWRSAFLALGVPGVIFGLLILVAIREPCRGRYDAAVNESPASFALTMRALGNNRAALHLIAACGLTTLWGWGLMWWTPTFLMRAYSLSAGQAGAITGPIHLAGGVLATLLTGWYVAQPAMADPRRVLWFLGAVSVVGTFASALVYFAHSRAMVTMGLWIFIPAIYIYIGPGFGLLNNMAEPRMRALFCATSLFVANVANLVVGPQIIGLLSDWIAAAHAQSTTSLRFALLCMVPTGFWSAFHYIRCARHIPAA